VLSAALAASGCASVATNAAADAVSGTRGVFATDDDPELIESATPFGLKTMEALLVDVPEHEDLLLSLTSGYAQYGYAFLAQDAHRLREEDWERAERLDARARNLYDRALGYGLRGLDVRHSGFRERLEREPEALREALSPDDVPFLYWTAAAWGLVIGASGMAPDSIADFPLAERLARWALELDPDWDDGAIHTLLMSIEANKPGGDLEAAEAHFQRALALDGGRRAGTFVSMAENVAVKKQDVVQFHELLEAALAVDVDRHPEDRLANVIMQRRAKRLLDREADLFLQTYEEATSTSTTGRTQP
jgi:tetratricopeptide (TPR) repeat protein